MQLRVATIGVSLLIAFANSQSPYMVQSTTEPVSASEPPASPSTSGSPPLQLGCGCDYPSLWLDIIFVLDSSSSMTSKGLQELLNYLGTAVLRMKIGLQVGQMSRIGIITYSDDATLRFSLNAFNSTDVFIDGIFSIPFEGRQGSNIEDGIRKALDEFEANGQGPFANRKKVIVIAASHYEPGGSNDPKQAAATFRGNGGSIITLEYVQNHGASVPILSDLASNCSQLTNRNEDLAVNDLLDTFCTANCFCPANWNSYSLDAKCYTPNAGCYFPVTIPSAWILAQRYCANQNGATLPTICDVEKATFMTSMLKNQKEAQWTGLQRATNGAFTWDDGTDYSYCHPSANPNDNCSWLNGTATPGQATAQLNTGGFRVGYFGASTFADYLYTCQNAPCSSTRYCQ